MPINYRKLVQKLGEGEFLVMTALEGQQAGQSAVVCAGQLQEYKPELEQAWREVLEQTGLAQQKGPVGPRVVQTSFMGAVYVEKWMEEPELVICGGGHVSQELACLADYLEYSYTVLDDRQEFASRERFPNARRCICQPFEQTLRQENFSSNAYYIIVTRGHAFDLVCLEQVLNRQYAYVGMIGSRKKVQKTMETLRQKGYNETVLKQIHAPIGLPIGGSSPKEVAVSIIAELIQVKNLESPECYQEEAVKTALLEQTPKVFVRIVAKRGSAPRGAGSRMVVGPEGIRAGTIGGGMIEFQAVRHAIEMLGTNTCCLRSYRLDTETAGSLGMWCGGEVDVFFESIHKETEYESSVHSF